MEAPVGDVRGEVERLAQVNRCLVQVQHAHVEPAPEQVPEHRGGHEHEHEHEQHDDLLVHLGVEGPDGVAEVHPRVEQSLGGEQLLHPEEIPRLQVQVQVQVQVHL